LSLDRCLLLARAARPADREALAARIESLARWHRGAATWTRVGEHCAAGAVRYDRRRESLAEPLAFGEEAAPRDVLAAPPAALRALDGATALLHAGAESACLVAGAGCPGMLFAASSATVDAWSTHAVAAAWLAHGRARVDPAAVPEQLAAEFVGGERSLIEGARPLPQAVRVTVADRGTTVEDLWPLAERWAALPEDEAAAHAERHLLASLERRVPAGAHASLTAGLDSRVVAVALSELGLAPRAFTWGEPGWDDVRGAAEVAHRLRLDHEVVAIEWLGDEDAMREVDRQARWTEGALQAGFARLVWPEPMQGFVTGAGGEAGRAFYYRDAAPAREEADPAELAGALVRLLEPRLAGARPEAVESLAASARGWVEAAAAAGHGGWRTLDVVYGEQRLRRWLRGMLPRLEAPMIPAFATPEIGRALASLPLDQRLSDGFHRGFLERRAPELVPRPAARRRRLRDRLPGRLRGGAPSPLRARWPAHPAFRDWVSEGVLGSPLVTDPLGERWAARTRSRLLAGDAHAEATALAAAAVVALADALPELGHDA
jgi:hypothetical protein